VWGYVQRARRGWSDEDAWNLDTYLAGVIAGSLCRLAATKHGIPCDFLPKPYRTDYSDAEFEAAEAAWTAWLLACSAAYQEYADSRFECDKGIYEDHPERMRRLLDHWSSLWD
jgi:hypothetical protein